MFPRRPFCRISSRLATGHRLSRSGGYARSPRLIYYYSRFENLCREFCATDENFFNRQKEEKEKRPATSTGRLLSPTPRMQLTQHPSCFTDYLRGVVRDLHLYRRNFPHSRTYGVQTALAPPLATECELLSASRGSRGGVTGHPHPPVSLATPSANLFHRG